MSAADRNVAALSAGNSGLRLERDGEIAILWIDQPERSVAVLDDAFLRAIPDVLDELDADDSVKGAVLVNAKPGSFLAGADISSFLTYESPEEVVAAIEEGNALLERIERWRKPLVVAVDGACLGGGTELALAARYVLASTNPKTHFALPEVQLGLLPGLGGTVRLPERIGLAAALDLMLTGRKLYAKQARRAGLAHATVHPEGLLAAAVQAARQLASGKLKPSQRQPKLQEKLLERTPARALIFQRAAQKVEKQTHGNYPAPQRILSVVKVWSEQGRTAGLEASSEAFAQLLFTPQARALIHLFFAQTASKRNPWRQQARAVERIAVLGAGLMGAGIAEVSAAAGIEVLLKDRDLELALKGKNAVHRGASSRVGKGRSAFERDQLVERVAPIDSYQPLARAQVTIEAVLEEPNLKREMLAAVEAVTADGHLFASNTSAIPIHEIAAEAARPEAVVGMHYFSPVPKMPLLEVVASEQSAEWALGTAVELGHRQGKTVIVVGDGPGFYTTRALGIYVGEVLRALREGADPMGLERAMVRYGFPLGPLAMMDDVGIDVGAKIQSVMADALKERGLEPDPVSAQLVAGGYLGRKAGTGFYLYEKGHRKQEIDPQALRLAGFVGGTVSPGLVEQGEALAERLAFTIVREALLCLEEGVLRSPRDGDLGAVFGFGFPPFRGGPFYLVDQLGPATTLDRFRALELRHGSRFAPPASLVSMATTGERFYP